MRKSHRKILVALNGRRKSITTSKLADETDLNAAGIYRALGKLEEEGLIFRRADGRKSLVKITDDGKSFLKCNPALDEIVRRDRRARVDYTDLHKLWLGIGLKTFTMSTDFEVFITKAGIRHVYWGVTKRFESIEDATAFVDARRGKTNVFYTPAATDVQEIKRNGKIGFEKTFKPVVFCLRPHKIALTKK